MTTSLQPSGSAPAGPVCTYTPLALSGLTPGQEGESRVWYRDMETHERAGGTGAGDRDVHVGGVPGRDVVALGADAGGGGRVVVDLGGAGSGLEVGSDAGAEHEPRPERGRAGAARAVAGGRRSRGSSTSWPRPGRCGRRSRCASSAWTGTWATARRSPATASARPYPAGSDTAEQGPCGYTYRLPTDLGTRTVTATGRWTARLTTSTGVDQDLGPLTSANTFTYPVYEVVTVGGPGG